MTCAVAASYPSACHRTVYAIKERRKNTIDWTVCFSFFYFGNLSFFLKKKIYIWIRRVSIVRPTCSVSSYSDLNSKRIINITSNLFFLKKRWWKTCGSRKNISWGGGDYKRNRRAAHTGRAGACVNSVAKGRRTGAAAALSSTVGSNYIPLVFCFLFFGRPRKVRAVRRQWPETLISRPPPRPLSATKKKTFFKIKKK